MAGRPKTRAMRDELERRTRELFRDDDTKTHLDFAEHYVADGGTLVGLAKSIAGSTGTHIMRESLRRHLDTFPDADARLGNARIQAAYALADEAQEILSDDALSKEDAPIAKLRVDGKLKLATMFNRAAFGEQKGASVTLNFGSLHLDALRTRNVQQLEHAQPLALAASDTEEAEVEVVHG